MELVELYSEDGSNPHEHSEHRNLPAEQRIEAAYRRGFQQGACIASDYEDTDWHDALYRWRFEMTLKKRFMPPEKIIHLK